MKTYKFTVYSPILKKSFEHTEKFKSMGDFTLYCYSLYSGNWKLVSIS